MSNRHVLRAASLWYPIMLAQERGELSEAKAAELLGVSVLDYRERKEQAISAVTNLVKSLPSPLLSLLDALREKPDLFE